MAVRLKVGTKSVAVDPKNAKLSSKKLTSLAVLEALPDVEELDISYNALRSLADMPRLAKLRTLMVWGNPLRDLRGLAKAAPALEKLSLDDLAKPAGISNLSLTHLWIKTQVKDLRFFAGHDRLSYLSITAPLTSLAGLDKLPALGELVIHGAKLGKVRAIAHPVLWKLILENSGLGRVPDLATPKLLLALFHNNAISRIGKLDAPVLRDLNLSRNPLAHLEGLENLDGLEQLSFDGRRIKTIAKATDAHLRARAKLQLSMASRGVADYAAFAAKKQIV